MYILATSSQAARARCALRAPDIRHQTQRQRARASCVVLPLSHSPQCPRRQVATPLPGERLPAAAVQVDGIDNVPPPDESHHLTSRAFPAMEERLPGEGTGDIAMHEPFAIATNSPVVSADGPSSFPTTAGASLCSVVRLARRRRRGRAVRERAAGRS